MQKLSICVGQGQEQGVGAGGVGAGGVGGFYEISSEINCTHI